MKYAVIKIAGHQYKVSEGDKIIVDKIGKSSIKADVLLYVDGDKVKVGKPNISGASVKLIMLNELLKGKKISVFKYKSKSRYRKKIGFRPSQSEIAIEKISL